MKEISKVIEIVLKDLNFNLSEEIKLSVFPDKVIRKAKDMFEKTEARKSSITNPFNKYYAMCLHESERLGLPADFTKAERVKVKKHYAQKSDTVSTEYVQKSGIEEENPFHPKNNTYKKKKNTFFSARQTHVTFNEGERYFKHGKWYAYPDQAIDKESNPCKQKLCDDTCGVCKTNKPINRNNIEPKLALLKAIESGNVNMQGLSFLRSSFLHKPDVLQVIDKALAYVKANAIDVSEFIQDDPKTNKEESNDAMPSVDMEIQKTFLIGDCRSFGNLATLL